MSISLRLPLTTAAANWMVLNNRGYDSLASWDVATQGWPPTHIGDPLYVAIVPTPLIGVGLTLDQVCTNMQKIFDPQEIREWVFAPGLIDDEIWLIHIKRIPTALN